MHRNRNFLRNAMVAAAELAGELGKCLGEKPKVVAEADLLALHTDYSLWKSYLRLDAVEKIQNPTPNAVRERLALKKRPLQSLRPTQVRTDENFCKVMRKIGELCKQER